MKRRGSKHRNAARAGAKPPTTLAAGPRAKGNRVLNEQTRKVLRRHYAARYRVR